MKIEERPCEMQPGDIKNCKIRYSDVSAFCHNKKVLDYSCGYGYGTDVLHERGINVLGIEPYSEVLQIAKEKFPLCNFQQVNEDGFECFIETTLFDFDIVVCMEVIEHLEFQDRDILLKLFSDKVPEIIASTPNGDMFVYKPNNKFERKGFHVCHYTFEELYEMFKKYYKDVVILGNAFDPRIARYTGHFIYAHN